MEAESLLEQERARYDAMTAGVRVEGAGYISDTGIEVLSGRAQRAAQVIHESPFLRRGMSRILGELEQTVVEELQQYRRGW
jgi:hypothetical protein